MSIPDYGSFWARLEELEKDGILPEWALDRQARSRATRERILSAAQDLLNQRTFDEVSLKEIAQAAGISVGAVYSRFPSKEAILLMLGIVVLDGSHRRFEEAFRSLGTDSFQELARAYVRTLVREFTTHSAIITEVRRHAGSVPSLRQLANRTNRSIHTAFLTRAREFSARMEHPDPERRLNYALFAVNAAGREAILAGALGTYSVEGGEDEFVDELTDMMTRFVGVVG